MTSSSSRMHHRAAQVGTAAAALVCGAALGLVSSTGAAAATPQACVVETSTCYPSIQQALDAAPDKATVRLSAGEFAGGVVISKDVDLTGAGADTTTVRGGGPVIVVESTKEHRPLVDIRSLTVTGGMTRSVYGRDDTSDAFGGGIFVPPVHGRAASLHLVDVVVSGNATAPATTADSPSGVTCPHRDCPYAGSYGGGIASFGYLSLKHSQVVGNTAGGRSSDADGGGIFASGGSVVINGSVISGNRAAPLEIGRYAEGGGLHVTDGATLVLRHSAVRGNTAELVTSWPVSARGQLIDMNANSGGVHVGDGSVVVVSRARITGNTARAVDPQGEPVAFDGAMLVGDSHLLMSRSLVATNLVEARTKTSKDVGFSGTALELDGPGTITRTRIVDNATRATTESGVAGAGSGLAVYDFSGNPRQVLVRSSVIAGNTALAESARGTAVAQGGGVMNNSLLRLVDVVVRGNSAGAEGRHTLAQGGGIWNGPLLSGPPVRLELRQVRVLNNSLSGGHGPREGGGIYTTAPLVVHGLTLRGNHPDQCAGC